MADPYFDERMQNRTLLIWAIATRHQVERWWEPVERYVRITRANETPDGGTVWAAAIEHHFLMVACAHLLDAINKLSLPGVSVSDRIRADVPDVRDLLEHWHENMPIFNVRPRPVEPPYASGKAFAERYPRGSPYSWLHWDLMEDQPYVTKSVSAREVLDLVAAVQGAVLDRDLGLARFVPIEWLPE